jgi:hypothetical protein
MCSRLGDSIEGGAPPGVAGRGREFCRRLGLTVEPAAGSAAGGGKHGGGSGEERGADGSVESLLEWMSDPAPRHTQAEPAAEAYPCFAGPASAAAPSEALLAATRDHNARLAAERGVASLDEPSGEARRGSGRGSGKAARRRRSFSGAEAPESGAEAEALRAAQLLQLDLRMQQLLWPLNTRPVRALARLLLSALPAAQGPADADADAGEGGVSAAAWGALLALLAVVVWRYWDALVFEVRRRTGQFDALGGKTTARYGYGPKGERSASNIAHYARKQAPQAMAMQEGGSKENGS